MYSAAEVTSFFYNDYCLTKQASQLSPLPTPQSFFLRQKKIAERFCFGVDRYASPLAWTYRPWRSRHSRRRFPHVRKKVYAKTKSRSNFFLASSTTRHSSLGRIDRNFFLIIFFDFWWRCAARRQKSKKMPS